MEKLSQAELDVLLSLPETITLQDYDLRGLVFPDAVQDLYLVRCCAEHLKFNGIAVPGQFVAEDCNLFGADFSFATFRAAAFRRCNLRTSIWSCVDAEALTFEDCDLTDATTPEGTVLDANANQDPEPVNNTPIHAGAADTPPPTPSLDAAALGLQGSVNGNPDTLPSETERPQP